MTEGLKHLGKPSAMPQSPEEAELDRVPNPHPDTVFWHGSSSPNLPRSAR